MNKIYNLAYSIDKNEFKKAIIKLAKRQVLMDWKEDIDFSGNYFEDQYNEEWFENDILNDQTINLNKDFGEEAKQLFEETYNKGYKILRKEMGASFH